MRLTISTSKPKRGKARPTTQLSKLQDQILEWLLSSEESIQTKQDGKPRRNLYKKGVAWSAKEFCKSYPEHYLVDGKPSSSKLSTSLRNLERRELIERYDASEGEGAKPRTSHVKLTDTGRRKAQTKRKDPRSWQEKREEDRLTRQAYGINYEIGRYGSQMSELAISILLVRYIYRVVRLAELEAARAEPTTAQWQDKKNEALKRLQRISLFEQLPFFADDGQINGQDAIELRYVLELV